MTIYLFTLIFYYFLLSIFLLIPLTCYPFSLPQLILLIYLSKICHKCLHVNEKHFLILQNEYDYFFCMSFVFFSRRKLLQTSLILSGLIFQISSSKAKKKKIFTLAHGIFQARTLDWVAISFSRGSSPPRDRTRVSRIAGRCFTV